MANLNIAIELFAKDSASGPLGKVTKGLGGLKTAVGGALTGALAVGGAAIVGVGVSAFNMSKEVQTATGNIQSELGTTAEEAERLGDIATDVWGNNFAGSITEAADAITLVRRDLGDLNDNEMKDATENAFRLQDAWEIGVSEGITTADTLMEEFGLTQQQAFDFMAKGFQNGLDRNGDFIDSIGEYSNLFAEAGFGADQFFSIMETGAAGGVLGTDKIADSVKEFQIIMNEGGEDVSAAWDSMGFNFERAQQLVGEGQRTWADYFPNIISGLQQIEDPIERNRLQVELFGTMAEDLGASFTEGLSTASTSLADMEGAIDSVDARYGDLTSFVEGSKRRFITGIQPIGATLLTLANNTMPLVDQAFAVFETTIVPAIETGAGAVQSFIGNLEEGMSPLDAFVEAIWDIAPQSVLDTLTSLRDDILPPLSDWFTNNVQPIIDMASEFFGWQDILVGLGGVVAAIVLPALYGIVSAAAPVIAVGAALVGAVALVRNAWENDWGGIRTAVLTEWETNIRPALEELWQWLSVNVPIALETLRAFWVDTAWPAIQSALEIVWPIIQGIFKAYVFYITDIFVPAVVMLYEFWVNTAWPAIQNAIAVAWPIIQNIFQQASDFIINTLIPTVLDLYTQWTTVWWPTIQTVLENVWTVVSGIFEELGRWVNDNIVPWVEYLWEQWTTVWWPEIQAAVENMWAVIEPIWTTIQEWLEDHIPTAVEGTKSTWETAMGVMESVITPVQTAIDTLKGAAEGFWNWITSHTFEFKISIPDLPDWATPGSPLPIHTAWANFERDMRGVNIAPQMNVAGVVAPATASRSTPATVSGGQTIYQFDFSGAVISSRADLERMIDQAMKKRGAKADIYRRYG